MNRSRLLRALVGFGWILLDNIVLVFGIAELVSLYANTVATGHEAIAIYRVSTEKPGGIWGVAFLIVSAILCARWSVGGFPPGTSEYKR